MSPERVYGGMTAEQRHQDRRTRLVDAAVDIMGSRGAAETTVTAVCTASRVTTRYFYQYFADRDALLRAVFDRISARLQADLVAAIPAAGGTPDQLALAPLGVFVRTIEDDRRLARILFIESGTEPTLRQLRSEFMAGLAELTLQQARLRLDIPDPAVGVAHLAATAVIGGLFEIFRRWLDGEIDYPADGLVEHCAGFVGSLGGYVLSLSPDAGPS